MSKSTTDLDTFFSSSNRLRDIRIFMKYNFRNDTIGWQMSKSTEDSDTFLL